jgi:hypothetical protein
MIFMKYLSAFLALALAKLNANDDLRFLRAISQVESANDDSAISKSGCRGRYQISAAAWAQHTKLPFTNAHNSSLALPVALKHLKFLRKELDLHFGYSVEHRNCTYSDLAMGWRYGWSWPYRMDRGIDHEEAFDYTRRVMSIFNDLD